MAQRGVREYDGKILLAKYWREYVSKDLTYSGRMVQVSPATNIDDLDRQHPWLSTTRLVVKPDQLFGKRGKHGLVKLDASLPDALRWIRDNRSRPVTIGGVTDQLTHFIIEPFVPHKEEYYVAVKSHRTGDIIFFSNHGGVDIESVWATVAEIDVDLEAALDELDIEAALPTDTAPEKRALFTDLARGLCRFCRELGFAFLEINPFVILGTAVFPLDLVARIDDTAHFECASKWGDLRFPAPFGRALSPEEKRVKEMDERSGASLKLTVLNPRGRIWTMIAGGGASVIYADTIVDLGYGAELANYGEYSGNPSADETYEYARTILDLMTRERDPQGRPKLLLIGGGIANFTDVASTFTGITVAIREYRERLIDAGVRIFVRRGGPNYQEGLRIMKDLGHELGIPIQVYGPETHMTKIVNMALEGN